LLAAGVLAVVVPLEGVVTRRQEAQVPPASLAPDRGEALRRGPGDHREAEVLADMRCGAVELVEKCGAGGAGLFIAGDADECSVAYGLAVPGWRGNM
jgi:hypothetical protein